jgi:hypothetical protein
VLAGHASAPNRALVGVLGGALLLAGCGQPPGFELEWGIAEFSATDSELSQTPSVDAVKTCSDHGIFWVHVTAKLGDVEVWEDEFACADSVRSSIEAPPLEPGEYTLEVEGLRRNHEPWAFDADAEDPRIAYDEVSVTVSEGEPPTVQAVLRAPPGCDDGIDNDLDGTVDSKDPGCEVQTPEGFAEANDADLTLFHLAVSFLGSPAIRPYNVGVNSIRLEVDGELLAEFADYDLDFTEWPWELPLVAGEYDEGTLTITAIGDDGPMTMPHELAFFDQSVPYTEVDFGSEMFLQPIVQPVALVFDPGCSPGGKLVLDGMRIRIEAENGDVPAGLTLMGLDPVNEWFSLGCPPATVLSSALTWGRYRIEAQAQLGNVTCFETPEPVELAPQPVSAQTITLERVLVNGQPACPECSEDLDCSSIHGTICDEGLCVEEEPGE